jgi:hypothetical protein
LTPALETELPEGLYDILGDVHCPCLETKLR